MSKDPAVLFYTSDFLSGTYTMSDEQVGKYIRLLCFQHQKGVLTEKDMLKICVTHDEDIWNKFVCEDGNYYNARMREEAEKRKKYSETRANNRRKKTHVEDILKTSNTYVPHMENENENIDEDVNRVYNEWELQKRTFIQDAGWKMKFITEKGADKETLETMMSEFVTDIELKEDWKSAKELRNHFTNLYNKFKRYDTNERGGRKNGMEGWRRVLTEEYASIE